MPGSNIDDDINWAYDMMLKKRVLGSQRALQFGGKPALKKNARIFNCTSSYCDRPRFFQECMWLLLCGCGTGFSVQEHHVIKLPSIARPSNEEVVYTIPDTIEGWSDAVGILLSSYFRTDDDHWIHTDDEGYRELSEHPLFRDFHEYAGKRVVFDFSEIREEGAELSSGIGKAPGPEPLKQSLEKIRLLLDSRLQSCPYSSYSLRPIDCYDIVMHCADAVLAGGVRRSATIAIFSPDDEEMAKAKTGDWLEENPQRARSNNSAILLRDKTSFEEFSSLIEHVKEYGEPGFIWADDKEFLTNPCRRNWFLCL